MSQAGQIGAGGVGPYPPFGPLKITFVTGPTTYTVLTTDSYIAVDNTAGATTLVFPATPIKGTVYIIKDRTGHATQYPITVNAGGTTIDLAATYTLAGNFDAIALLYDGLNNYEIW